MMDLSPKLLQFGRLAPLDLITKKACRSRAKVNNHLAFVDDRLKHMTDCRWALRLNSSELIALNLHRPGNGSWAGGVRMIDWIETEEGKRLPHGPVACSESDGEQRYFRLPATHWGLMKNTNDILPSIDILVRGGLVVVPPTPGWTWIESFDDIDITGTSRLVYRPHIRGETPARVI